MVGVAPPPPRSATVRTRNAAELRSKGHALACAVLHPEVVRPISKRVALARDPRVGTAEHSNCASRKGRRELAGLGSAPTFHLLSSLVLVLVLVLVVVVVVVLVVVVVVVVVVLVVVVVVVVVYHDY